MRRRPLVWALLLYILVIVVGKKVLPEPQLLEKQSCKAVAEVAKIGEQQLLLSDVEIEIASKKIHANHVVVYNQDEIPLGNLKIGNIITISGTIQSPSKPGNPGQFNEYEYSRQQNIQYKIFAKKMTVLRSQYHWWKQSLFELRQKLCKTLEAGLNEENAGIMKAMLFGEKKALSQEVKSLYQVNGIAHLLAISGLHVTLLGGTIFAVLRRKFLKMQYAAVVTIIFLILYGELTGFSVATSRAVIMMICMLSAYILGRSYDLISAACLAALITLLQQPYVLFSSGFLLSYGTIVGIVLVFPSICQCFPLKRWEVVYGKKRVSLLKSLLGSFSISLITAPVILCTFYEIPLYGVFLNVLVLPIVSLLVGIGFVASFVSLVFSPFGEFLFGTVHFILLYFKSLCRLFSCLPANRIITGHPELIQVFLYFVGLVCFLVFARKKMWFFLPGVCMLLVIFFPRARSELSVTALDVGQGDCIYVESGAQSILIDGGSSSVTKVGEYRICPFLKYQGVNRIDTVFLTHPDEDHVNGIMEMIREKSHLKMDIAQVVVPAIEGNEALNRLVYELQRNQISVRYMKSGMKYVKSDCTIDCLWPIENREYENANDYSLVLKVQNHDFSALFMGDLGSEQEKEIINQIQGVDLVKVGHHGSKYSTCGEFLQKCSPAFSIISVGENNRYGHPSIETMIRLQNIHTNIFRTDKMGACFVDGKRAYSFRKEMGNG